MDFYVETETKRVPYKDDELLPVVKLIYAEVPAIKLGLFASNWEVAELIRVKPVEGGQRVGVTGRCPEPAHRRLAFANADQRDLPPVTQAELRLASEERFDRYESGLTDGG